MRILSSLFTRKPSNVSHHVSCFDAVERSYLTCRLSLEKKIIDVNDRFLQAVDYAREELIGTDYMRLVRPKDQQDTNYKKLWADLAQGVPAQFIRPRLNKAGEERWFDVSYLPLVGSNGAVNEVLLLAHDITEMHLRRRDNRSKVDALSRTMAVIEFDLQGNILMANQHFLDAAGYTLEEIVGKHHRIFMLSGEADTPAYANFWKELGAGASKNGQVRRKTKSGEVCWLEATYETLTDPEGRPFKVVKYAFDITASKNREAECDAKLASIEQVQAVIEFTADGKITYANDLFCQTMGYDQEEIIGKPHSIFVEDAYAKSADYIEFWKSLGAGKANASQFKRIRKNGKPVYIEASYNPIKDASGRVVKVVKFAVDTTIFQTAVSEVGATLDRVSSGDLTARVQADLGPLNGLKQSLNLTVEKLQSVIDAVTLCAGDLAQEAQAIRSGSHELSRRTETQAATLEESAAALEELTSSVSGATQMTVSARQEVQGASAEANSSAKVVDEAIEAMGGIADSSRRISSITSVIDDIAFQTNLLALNAGVEAARAGDAGRGFAVVASEVRALAQRSAEAAREIGSLLVESEKCVAEGGAMVDRAGSALKSIVQRVESINGMIATIASSASEQASGLSEMNSAVSDLDRSTQQNAAMAEETNAAVVALNQRIEQLLEDVSFFSRDKGADHTAAEWVA
ncbi:PAS domain-containing methyl-accepting chemotaxis protein [Thioclava sp. 'Guangxiensis']|uniref:methyl-accepting chemotaxis protein n=1 Tax=Thioclava sp. 'Guangxiensis' TaxID=3149044 RepID=UPI003877AC53